MKIFCKQHNITESEFIGKEKIKKNLYLSGLTSIPNGFNPTVGRGLYLSGLTSIQNGFNPTVGGYLDLRGLTSIPNGFNPTVGGSLSLKGLDCEKRELVDGDLNWQGGKYRNMDGIFCEVIHKRGAVIKCKYINGKEFYVVTDGNGRYSHGNTIKEAREDLVYKISDRDKSKYKGFTKETELTFEESVECYMVVTGSCSFGTKEFVSSLENKKEKYSIGEIIQLTENQYGNDLFKSFFN